VPQPAEVSRIGEELVSELRRTWEEVMELQRQALQLRGRNQRRRRLQVIEGRIAELIDESDASTRRWIAQRYPKIYFLGAVQGARAAGAVFDEWTDLHLNAIQRIANDTFADLLEATAFVREDTKRFISEVSQGVSLDVVEGTPALRGGTLLERQLSEHGISAVIYRDGSRHDLAEYSQVVIRTKTAVAYNTATLNAGKVAGVQFYEVFDGPNCGWMAHDDTERALGKITTYEESLTWPISHPQCRRSFGARPEIRTAEQASLADKSVTEAQTEDIRRADAERAAIRSRRAQRVRQRQIRTRAA
jgi:hypothetical protein